MAITDTDELLRLLEIHGFTGKVDLKTALAAIQKLVAEG